jgi:hypothetical protein
MISIGEVLMARIALENVLADLSDEQERESLKEAVNNTIAGKPVATAPAEGETDADTISNR